MGAGSKKHCRLLTPASVYAFCPDCGARRRAYACNPAGSDLYVRCHCKIDPLFGIPNENIVDLSPAAVGHKGGLAPESVGAYLGRVALWRQASLLRAELSRAGVVPSCHAPKLSHLITMIQTPRASCVLSAMPTDAMANGLEEWVCMAERALLTVRLVTSDRD